MDNIIIDTNVLVSALRSNQGASYQLLKLVGKGSFDISVSISLVLEYEDVLKRQMGTAIALTPQDIDDVLDYLCLVGQRQRVYYLWRPALRDPHDDMILELAVSAECQFIITYNVKDFQGVERFGIKAISPKTFLEKIGALP